MKKKIKALINKLTFKQMILIIALLGAFIWLFFCFSCNMSLGDKMSISTKPVPAKLDVNVKR